MGLDWIGYLATAAFASSYFVKRPEVLRRVQAGAAAIWIGYGLLIHSMPVVVANGIVAAIAVVTTFRKPREQYSGDSRLK
jgi:hypothetical protein